MKRSLFVIIVIAACSISAQAKYSGGSGEPNNPYQIDSADDLLTLAADTNDYNQCFILTADIDLAAYTFTTAVIAPDINNSSWEFDGVSFTGDFNGDGHIIRNLTIDTHGVGNDYLGLFGSAENSRIRNLQMKNVRITGGSDTYCIGGLAGGNMGDIINCSSTGVITSDSNSSCLGGLVGYNDGGDINICNSVANINGGFNVDWIGGLVGINCGNISHSFSRGDIKGSDYSDYIGGLAGENWNGTISNSYSTGDVSGGKLSYFLGGLVGSNNHNISNCYSAGVVTSGQDSNFVGGLAGNNDPNGVINNCFFPVKNGPGNEAGWPLKDTLMRQRASFVGWDFINIWKIDEGVGYPVFIWEPNQILVKKCAVAAGIKPNSDTISFSGTMNATADDFNGASVVTVTIDSEDMDSPYVKTFDVNSNTFKNGKFKGTIVNKPSKIILTFDTKKKAFSFSASNVSIAGLSVPLTIGIEVGGYNGEAWLYERIVNGPKKPIPINLLMGVKNSLLVNNKPKLTKKSGVITQVAISGGFSDKNANDANLLTNQLDITIGSQTFTIPTGKFKNTTKGKFTCSNVNVPEGGIAAATFDFNKCTFILTIKNTNFTAGPGTVDFNMEFGDFNEGAEISLP